jgi:hypothetical protein
VDMWVVESVMEHLLNGVQVVRSVEYVPNSIAYYKDRLLTEQS